MRMVRALLVFAVMVIGAAQARPAPRLKPAPPPPPFITTEEAQLLLGVFNSLDDRQYTSAKSFLSALDTPIARKIGNWALLASNAPDLELRAYDAFLDVNGAWPNPITLQRKAERLIDEDTAPEAVLTFFDTRDPVSGFGKFHLARALLAVGNEEAAAEFAREAWIEHNFNAADSQDIRRTFRKILTKDDHFAKADRALFRRSTGGIEDVDGLLDRTRAREVAVRADLLRGRSRGRTAFNNLSADSQRDSGVLHAMVRYLRRSDSEPEAIRLAGYAPTDPAALRDPGAWYYERRLLARWALENGRFEDAYNLVAYSGLTEGSDFSEAEFMAGWIALRFLDDPETALAHFRFLTENVSSPISLARGNYWIGRAHAAAGRTDEATAFYRVASDFPYTFYGQLAIESLGQAGPGFTFPAPVFVTEKDRAKLMEKELAQAMAILDHLDQHITYRRFALALDNQLTEPEQVLAYADMVRDAGEYDLIVRGGKVARSLGAQVPEVIYPPYPVPRQAVGFAEEPLILGLSRQESEFRVDAVSPANAKGLMQLLNSTARLTARKEGFPYVPSRLTSDPGYNLVLGAAHLSHLIDRFDGSYILTLAAYNAGPHRAERWIKTFGDPRDPDVDPIDWIELVPFSETRNYIMRVMENVQVYRSRIAGTPLGIQLTEDLTRGGSGGEDVIGQPTPVPVLFVNAQLADPPILEAANYAQPPLAIIRNAARPVRVDPVTPQPVATPPQGSVSNK